MGGPFLLVGALACGAVGDVCLSRNGDGSFLAGLGAFLLGHLMYAALFLNIGLGVEALTAEIWRILAALALVLTGVVVFRVSAPNLGTLKNPFALYVCVSVVVGVCALLLPTTWPLIVALIGSLLFISSDVILAFELFVLKPNSPARAITSRGLWFLYWGGQMFIAVAVLKAGDVSLLA
ncbi:MAG: lysoplasmalogenase family protein [Pseudomonadota bacterium]